MNEPVRFKHDYLIWVSDEGDIHIRTAGSERRLYPEYNTSVQRFNRILSACQISLARWYEQALYLTFSATRNWSSAYEAYRQRAGAQAVIFSEWQDLENHRLWYSDIFKRYDRDHRPQIVYDVIQRKLVEVEKALFL